MPTITIKFYGPARDVAGGPSMPLDIEDGQTVEDVARQLGERFPRLRDAVGVRLAVNRAYVPMDHALADGDEVAVIPPVSGGAPSPRIALIREPIDVAALVEDLQDENAGAVASFTGTVRRETQGDRVLVALDYHAYEDMALEQLRHIRERALADFDILDAAVVHRLGRLELGAASIAVVAVAPHRAPAFDACRRMLDAVKADAPIWKKDVWADGSLTWVDPL